MLTVTISCITELHVKSYSSHKQIKNTLKLVKNGEIVRLSRGSYFKLRNHPVELVLFVNTIKNSIIPEKIIDHHIL